MSAQYKVGDRPWWAIYERLTNVEVLCPVCYGNCAVRLILGNGDEALLPCNYCGHSFDPPTGYVTEYQAVAKAEQVTIGIVNISETAAGQDREYRVAKNFVDGSCWAPKPEDLFDTEEEANARATEKAEADRIEHETRAEHIKKNAHKSFAWNAGYHMREAKRHRHDIEYHERMAVVCKARGKDGAS